MAIDQSESALPATERRKFQRLRFSGKIEIEWGSTTLLATVRDICVNGMFIELIPPLWIGANFSACLPVTPAIRLNCTVRRVDPEEGIAVTFDVLEESGKLQLEALLTALPQV